MPLVLQVQASGFVVRGRIVSGLDHSPIDQSAQVLLDAAGFQQFQITDSLGRFRFPSVPSGTYKLTVRALSYHPLRDSIRVSHDTAFTIVMPAHCHHDSLSALRDIAQRRVKVLLHTMLAMSPSDTIAQRRFGFEYEDSGDMVYEPLACEEQYNRVVFRYFDKRFGWSWRNSVRAAAPDNP